ncbi:mitochondrial carrier [Aspergillus aculeatinus CBS 121060]|uniref:Mitochondrial carrier n=1 Tax=Aspergillus aculeatinus CBS 121060 TaxID=1448322 RepID=A0ACD1HNF8_9EURO|nr:mitochondrial carrier [Aspergillus aculeatinus CBS 121060]RAH75399.1 mitochondrial carrier [Aspergillus aculeatinus CBS 121060]
MKREMRPEISLLAGAFAGVVEASITYPFEFAKTRSQLGVTGTIQVSTSRNPLTLVRQTIQETGFQSVYQGCSTLVLGTAFKAGVRFLSFDSIRGLLSDSNGRLSPVQGVLAGVVAGTVESVVAVTPTERIKTALIDDARSLKRFKSGMHALSTVVSETGVAGLYRGLVSTTLKQVATSAVRMGTYNSLKELIPSSTHDAPGTHGPIVTFGLGAGAGVITVYATQPFDTIKTRAQAAQGLTTLEATRAILRDGGLPGFWRGSSMRLGRLILSGGIVFTTYESIVSLFEKA